MTARTRVLQLLRAIGAIPTERMGEGAASSALSPTKERMK